VSIVGTRLETAEDLQQYREQILRARDPGARRVRVCLGTGCTAKGAPGVFEQFRRAAEELEDESVAVESKSTGCHGFCERGPIVVVDPGNIFYQDVTEEDVPEGFCTGTKRQTPSPPPQNRSPFTVPSTASCSR